MTVQELIDYLQGIEDKEMDIVIVNDLTNGGCIDRTYVMDMSRWTEGYSKIGSRVGFYRLNELSKKELKSPIYEDFVRHLIFLRE